MLHTKFIQIWYLDGWVKIWAGNNSNKKFEETIEDLFIYSKEFKDISFLFFILFKNISSCMFWKNNNTWNTYSTTYI